MLPFCERIISVPRAKYLPSKNRGIPVPKEPETIGGHLRRRRLQLGIPQSEAALRLGVSTVTLSRWECDKVYPTWAQQPAVAFYLGYDSFTNLFLGRPGGNETQGVAFFLSEATANLLRKIVQHCIKSRKTRSQFAKDVRIDPKTIRNWETDRREPSPQIKRRIGMILESYEGGLDV